MITTLSALLASKYGKYILEVAMVLGLVFCAYKWAEHRGRDAQAEQDKQATSVQLEADRKEASALNSQLVQQANEKATAAQSDAEQAREQFATLAAEIAALTTRSQQGQQQVLRLADSELHGDIVGKLALRPANDPAPGYTPQEERKIDEAVTQYPIAVQQAQALSGEVDQRAKEAQANLDLANAREQAFEADESYIASLSKYWAELFNQHAPHKRAGKCLYLWGCGRITITPNPPARGGK